MILGGLPPKKHGEDLHGLLPFTLSTFWPIRPIKIAEKSLIGVFKFAGPVLLTHSSAHDASHDEVSQMPLRRLLISASHLDYH